MPHNASIEEPQAKSVLPSAKAKRQLVQRVVGGEIFRRSSALCAFLLYVTNHEILGQTDHLKERTIGIEALGRRPDYNPVTDNIVRVRAHELRGRLERYFASEGAHEPVVITIPAGSYVPMFVPRKMVTAEASAVAPAVETGTAANAPLRGVQHYLLLLVAAAVVVLTASIVVIRYAWSNVRTPPVSQEAPSISAFWSQFFQKPHEELHVVYSDPGFALWQDLNGVDLNLGDYLNQAYLNNSDKLHQLAVRRVASPADAEIATRLGVLAGQFGGQVNLQPARDVNSEFFQHGNIVLLGSRHSNPWVEPYESSLDFRLSQDPYSKAPLFQNRFPQHGEQSAYGIPAVFDRPGSGIAETEYKSYGVIALLKGCGDRGFTVILEGLNSQATKAVGDVLTDPQRLDSLLRSIGDKPGKKVGPFEALIQVTSLPNSYSDTKVIAYRIPRAGICR